MNEVLIVDASESDRRLMSSLLTRAGYEPIPVESMEAAKEEVAILLNVSEKTLIQLRKKHPVNPHGEIEA